MSDLKKFWASFTVICVASLILHVLVFSKRQGRDQHHPLVYPDSVPAATASHPGVPTEGRVSALGTDRFYLEVEGRQQMYLYGSVGRPTVNERVRVHYNEGTPPIATKVERL